MKTKILIVDDHSFTRAGIRAIIETSKDFEIVGEAADGNEAILKMQEKQPDIIIMDINMPGKSGIEVTKEILLVNDTVKILALTMHSGEQFVKEMLNAGAVGYMLKDDAPEELIKAINKIVAGQMILSSDVIKAALTKESPSDLNILQTKLHRPQIPNDFVKRKNVFNILEDNVRQPFSLISAGAGYGKSMTVSNWLEKTNHLYTWISLDQEQNDFRTFLLYLVAAIEQIFPTSMKDTNDVIRTGQLPPFKVIFTTFINELCNIDQDFILVLDDYHIIRETEIHDFFKEWMHFPPPNVHLSIITRRDPPLNLVALRRNGKLVEIRTKELCLSNEEIEEFFNNLLGVKIGIQNIKLLQAKTEGWIIGLKLASMAINDESDVARILQSLDGGMTDVSDYLLSEVLSKQPKNLIRLIIESSVLDRFCKDLIVKTINNDGEIVGDNLLEHDFIQWLIKSNMFIISLDSEQKWFRYHHLFQRLLQNQLRNRRTTKQIYRIHQSASEWFEKNNFIQEAINHSIKAKNIDRAIEIVANNWEDTFDKDLWYLVEGWMSKIPKEHIQKSVRLLLAQLWINQKRHKIRETHEIITLINEVNSDLTDKELGHLAFAKTMIALLFGEDLQKALAYANQALRLIPKTHFIFRADTFGWWTVAMQVNGRGEEAIKNAEEQLKIIDPPGEPVQMARRTLHPNFVDILKTDLASMKYRLKKFFALPNNSLYVLSVGWYFKASISWWAYDQDGAINGFEKVIGFKYLCRPRNAIEAFIGKAISLQELNKTIEANKTMEQGIDFAKYTKDLVNINIIESGSVRLKLMQGDIGEAENWIKIRKFDRLNVSMLWWVEVPSITRCRVLIALNTTESLNEAIDLLEGYRIYAESIFNKLRTIEILALQATAFLKLKRVTEAKNILKNALELASDDQFIRPFIIESEDFHDLLFQLRKQGVKVKAIDLILSKIKNIGNNPIPLLADQEKENSLKNLDKFTAFTRKEIQILHCVSDGLSNSEIADKLFNSEQTIKKHLSNMFQKIQVRNRLNLVSKAKELGRLE